MRQSRTFSTPSLLTVILVIIITCVFAPRASAQPTATLTVAKTNAYELNPLNEGRFTVTLSAADVSPITVNYSLSGTAVNGTDYSNLTTSATIPAGQTTATIRVRPIDNSLLDGDRTVILTLTSGTGYTVGSPNSGTVTIHDDDLQSATLVYFQNFDIDDSANWTINTTASGSNTANIFFDYSTVGIPPAPNSTNGTTRGLRLQANIIGGNPSAIFPAGVSVSPTGLNITNTSYRLRFDMWCNYNGPVNGGGSGSTHLTGGGVGTAGNSVQVAGASIDSMNFNCSGDGGTTSDYRGYSPDAAASYQDNSGVYAAGTQAGSRNNTDSYYHEFGPEAAPPAQTNLFPGQTGVTAIGAAGFLWRDVLITKVGDSFTYSIDGKLIATVLGPFSNPLGGTDILFNQFDINGGASTDPNSFALQFGLIDNVRVEGLTVPIVTVTATTPDAAETGPANGVFTLTRLGDTNSALTVKYTMSGTASNGVDYTSLPGTVTFAAGADSTNITLVPIDDTVSEFTETAILNLVAGTNYATGAPRSATVNIVDNDPVTIDVIVARPTMYERITNDYITFRLQRRGDLGPPVGSVNLAFSGTATSGVDFVPTNGIAVDGGAVAADFTVSPLDDNLLEGSETVVVSVVAGSGYAVGTNSPSATGTILDDETPPATVLFSDSLNSPSSASNWQLRFMANNLIDDYLAEFGADVSTNFDGSPSGMPPAPNGSSNVLKVTVNKFEGTDGGCAGLNLYPIGQTFSNNFAVRVNLYHREGSATSFSTEFALLGINHSGNQTNWFRQNNGSFDNPPRDCDGLFFGMTADASSSSPGDFVLYTGNGTNQPTLLRTADHLAFTNVFKKPPFTPSDGVGVPANAFDSTTPVWDDVEIRYIGHVATWLINNSPVLTYTNTTAFRQGNIMLGYCDPYLSIGSDGAAYFSNVRVVRLDLNITRVQLVGTNAVINFTWSLDEPTSAFNVQRAALVTGAYTNVTTATITKISPGVYQATAGQIGSAAFYRIRR